MDPAEFQKPGWATIRHRQQALQAARQAPAQTTATPGTRGTPQRGHRRPVKRQPPVSPLPESDIKIVLRPRGGLALAAIAQATLADAVQAQAGLAANREDQIRVQHVSNYILVSTPLEDRATRYASITSLTLRGQQYEIAAHVSAPANTVAGVIFNIPEDDTPEQIRDSICNYNPDMRILDVKRLNSSNMAQILFDGTKVPFWIRYRATTYRCKPFRRKTEACAVCWQQGHRQDVCPNAQAPARCSRCGTMNAAENHNCSPRCIVCEGPHLTGSADCPRRYQPRRRHPTYAQVVSSEKPTKDSFLAQRDEPSLSSEGPRPPPRRPARDAGTGMKTTTKTPLQPRRDGEHRQKDVRGYQVSCPSAPTSSSSHPPPPPSLSPDILKELNAIRAEITLLRQENATLRHENQSLKQQIIHRKEDPSPPNAPPPKRKALSSDPQSPPEPSDRDEQLQRQITSIESSCKLALSEQKAEYSSLHQAVLANFSTFQANLEELRAQMQSWVDQIGARINASTASSAATDPLYNPVYGQH